MGKRREAEQLTEAVERAVSERRRGRPDRALDHLAEVRPLVASGAGRRELRVAAHRELALTHLVRGEPDEARRTLGLAHDEAGERRAESEPTRALRAVAELAGGDADAARTHLASRRCDRRSTLLARARLELYEGDADAAEETLQQCEQAPGGVTDLDPPSTALRSLVALWQGRPEQARMLYQGVAADGSPWWMLVRILLLRARWVRTGDARHLALATDTAEELRFGELGASLPGLQAAAAGHHAALLALTAQLDLAGEAAEEAWTRLDPVTLPEWPRPAIVHDVALYHREAGRAAESLRAELRRARSTPWHDRARAVTGPRGEDVTTPASPGTAPADDTGAATLAALGVDWVDDGEAPRRALLQRLVDRLGAHGGRWVDARGRAVARIGSAASKAAEEASEALELADGGRLLLDDPGEDTLGQLDRDGLDRLASAATRLEAARERERRLEDTVARAEAGRVEATRALERLRRGGTALVAHSGFPSVAGHSRALRRVLDRLAHLAHTALPIVLEGPPGAGRRHLARAFVAEAADARGPPPTVDLSLVPAADVTEALERAERRAEGGSVVVVHAEELDATRAADWLERWAAGEAAARPVLTLDGTSEAPVAASIRRHLDEGRVRVPGLDERLEDLPHLVDALADAIGHPRGRVGTAARAVLARRSWPGHVAELRDVLARAAVRAAGGTILPEHLHEQDPRTPDPSIAERAEQGYHEAVRGFRRDLLRHALRATDGNRTRAAELLGLQRTYLVRLVRDLGADDGAPETGASRSQPARESDPGEQAR